MPIGTNGSAQGANTGGSSSVTTGNTDTQVSGSTFVLFASTDGTFTTFADNKGNSYTQIQSELVWLAGGAKNRLYYCENAAGGAGHNWTVSLTGNSFLTVLAIEITGADSGPLDANPAASEDTASPFVTASTGVLSQANEVIVAVTSSDSSSNAAYSNSSGFQIQQQVQNGTTFATAALATLIVSATTAQTCSFTQSGATRMGTQIVSFKERPAATPSIAWARA